MNSRPAIWIRIPLMLIVGVSLCLVGETAQAQNVAFTQMGGYLASWSNLAITSSELGMFKRALVCAKRASALVPGDGRVERLLHECQKRCEKETSARTGNHIGGREDGSALG